MRYTFGTVAALAASLLIAAAFWPESPQAPAPRIAVAQGFGGGGAQQHKPGGTSVATEDNDKAAAEGKLAKRIGEIDFVDVPLTDAIDRLSERIEIDVLIDRGALTDEGVALDQPVTLKVYRANPTARMTLELLLEPVKLSYTIRDGLIMVTTTAQANQILVYNVRDLAQQSQMDVGAAMSGSGGAPGMSGMRGRGGMAEMMKGMGAMQVGAPGGVAGPGAGAGAMMGGMGGGIGGPIVRHTESLAEVIATTIDPDSWDSQGGNGSVVQYHDLLVVKNSQTVHGKIKALLEMMRASARSEPGAAAPAAVPGAGGSSPAGPAGTSKQ
jgi:hypothetical protein